MFIPNDCNGPNTSPFDDALADLRISGAVLLHEVYTAPWAVTVPAEDDLRAVMGAGPDVRIVPFHLARRNSFIVEHQGTAMTVTAPTVMLCGGGYSHTLRFRGGTRAVPIEDILAGRAIPPAGDDPAIECLCGVFTIQAPPLNPIVASLPPMLVLPIPDGEPGGFLRSAADLLAAVAGRGRRDDFTMLRLLEILCAEVLRAYKDRGGPARASWFRGLADPRIAAAMARMHKDPAAPWTVASLADAAALSPSRFAARFREVTGQPVMTYIGQWRANIACRLLRDTGLPLDGIAVRAGYSGAPSLSRAFKASFGVSPARWRARVREQSVAGLDGVR